MIAVMEIVAVAHPHETRSDCEDVLSLRIEEMSPGWIEGEGHRVVEGGLEDGGVVTAMRWAPRRA